MADSIDDVWGAAQNVTMWLNTAQQSLGDATNRGMVGFLSNLLSGSRAGKVRVNEAVDAVGKAKVAFADLEYALHAAEMPRVQLAAFDLILTKTPDLGPVGFELHATNIRELREALTHDLATLEQLVTDVEARQRSRRSEQG